MIGSVLGNRYELIDKVGEGGMAVVYKARCRLLNRFVAVKILKTEFQEDAEFLRRFSTEAQAAASLSHSNIVSVYDVGTHGKLNYIVMEYVEGITLKEYMSKKEETLSVSEAADFSLQIASALEHAHSKKIIHRDIKPQNIVITNTGVLKVMDFGLARAVSSATTVAGNSEALGSVHYASPEQARGGFTDERSDIYSLGVVMYEMFTGELPFDGDTPVAVAMKHLQRAPMPPRMKNENIPEAVEAVILRAMQKEARERYPDVTAMIADIKEAVKPSAHTKSVPTDKFSTRRLPVLPEDELQEEKADTPAEKPVHVKKKEDRIAIIAAIVTSVIIVGVLGFIIARVFYMGDGAAGRNSVVPSLVGQSYDSVMEKYGEVFTIAEEQRVHDNEYAAGYIISQSPDPGERVGADMVIDVVISLGSKTETLPDFTERDYRSAEDTIKRLEMNLSCEIIEEHSDSVDAGKVIRQSPAAGTAIKAEEKITLYVSKGKNNIEVEMPNIVGKDADKAKEILEASGLSVGNVSAQQSSQPRDTVISQSVAAGNMVSSSTAIDFTVSTGEDEGGQSKVKRKIALTLPSDRENVNVKIISGEDTVLYHQQHSASGATVMIEVESSGRQTLEIFYDDVLDHSMSVNF